MQYKLFTFLAVVFLAISCEEEMIMIPEIEVPITDKVVLIEELTGVQCPNCPKGTAAIENIIATFGGNVLAIGIHGEQQAEPLKDSKYDFRNQKAKDLETYHKPFLGKPAATINRVQFDAQTFIPVDDIDLWSSLVEELLFIPLEVDVNLSHTYNPFSRIVNVDAGIIPVVNLDGENRISVFVTESGIIDLQENQGVIIEEYEHNHVLRHMMTSFDGDQLGDNLQSGAEINRSFAYTIPDEFDDTHMEVIVAVHRNTADSREILQAAAFKVR